MKGSKGRDASPQNDVQRRYAIRKLSVGAASVAIGLFLAGSKPAVVRADAPVKAETTAVVAPTKSAESAVVSKAAEPQEANKLESETTVATSKASAAQKVSTTQLAAKDKTEEPVKKPVAPTTTKARTKEKVAVAKNDKAGEQVKSTEKSGANKKATTQKLTPVKQSAAKDAKKALAEEKLPARRSRGSRVGDHWQYNFNGRDVEVAHTSNDIYNFDGWNIEVINSGSFGLGNGAIRSYTGHKTDVVMPNTSDLIDANVIAPGKEATIYYGDFRNILHSNNNQLKSLTISNDDPAGVGEQQKKVHASDGGAPAYSGDSAGQYGWSNNYSKWDAWDNMSEDSIDWYPGTPQISTLDLRGLDVSALTSLGRMFDNAKSLTSVDISTWDTSHVKDFRSMFAGCNRLQTLKLPAHFVQAAANYLDGLFSGDSSLQNIEVQGLTAENALSQWDTSNVKGMSSVFCNNQSLPNLNLGSWRTGKVTNMSSMFQGTHNEEPGFHNNHWNNFNSITNWDTSHVTSMNSMFDFSDVGQGTDGNFDLSHWNVGQVTDMEAMFSEARFLKHLNTTGWDTHSLTNMANMFRAVVDPPTIADMSDHGKISKLATIAGIGNWDVSHVTKYRQLGRQSCD